MRVGASLPKKEERWSCKRCEFRCSGCLAAEEADVEFGPFLKAFYLPCICHACSWVALFCTRAGYASQVGDSSRVFFCLLCLCIAINVP